MCLYKFPVSPCLAEQNKHLKGRRLKCRMLRCRASCLLVTILKQISHDTGLDPVNVVCVVDSEILYRVWTDVSLDVRLFCDISLPEQLVWRGQLEWKNRGNYEFRAKITTNLYLANLGGGVR